MVDHFASVPAVVSLHQPVGQLIVGNGDQGLDAVFCKLVEDIIIELQARLIGLLFHSGRENARPVDGHAKDLEAHLGRQSDVLFVVMIKIGRLAAGIQGPFFKHRCHALGRSVAAVGAVIRYGSALAVHIPGTFVLICGGRAAPQKIFSE